MLENEHIPLRNRREPYWRPRPASCFRDVYTPDWGWLHPAYTPDMPMDVSILDRNGAFISAASSASFAHGALDHTGALPSPCKRPGYYRIDWHDWQDTRIVSPLGSAKLSGKIWVAHPTLELLQQLEDDGKWPGIRIHDSWTSEEPVRFREWATACNVARAGALRRVQDDEEHDPTLQPGSEECGCPSCPWYKAVKDGYSVAVQLMLGPGPDKEVKSGVKRPDWYHTIHAQHAATTWRYVWKALRAGYEPVMMGSTDEVAYPTLALPELQEKELIKMDLSGVALGTFKVKETIRAEVPA
jgi:hypothetical protein